MPVANAGAPDLPLDPILEFLRALWLVEQGLQRASKRMDATLGITGPQRLVLRVLRAHPGLTAASASRIRSVKQSRVLPGVVSPLEAGKLFGSPAPLR